MKTKISALLDGELESHEVAATLRTLRDDAESRERWCDYRLIGDSLRGESHLSRDITARVMVELQGEPTVLAPRRAAPPSLRRPLTALAASAAGVAVVGWLTFAPGTAQPPAARAMLAGAEAARVKPVAGQDMQGYLVAHQAYSSTQRMYAGAENIRSVSASGLPPRR